MEEVFKQALSPFAPDDAEKEVCEMCGRELDEEELDMAYEFDDGKKWCGSCFLEEKCR